LPGSKPNAEECDPESFHLGQEQRKFNSSFSAWLKKVSFHFLPLQSIRTFGNTVLFKPAQEIYHFSIAET
jgi:hypothetical protein